MKFRSMSEYASTVLKAALPPSHPASTAGSGSRASDTAQVIRLRSASLAATISANPQAQPPGILARPLRLHRA